MVWHGMKPDSVFPAAGTRRAEGIVSAAKATASADHQLMLLLHQSRAASVRSHSNAVDTGIQDASGPSISGFVSQVAMRGRILAKVSSWTQKYACFSDGLR